jgi:hypothetical protein
MRIPLQHVLERARHRPPGYVEEVLAAAGISSPVESLPLTSYLELPTSVYEALCAKYRPAAPELRALATDYEKAIASWRSAGYPVLDEAAADTRADRCALCEQFRIKDGRLVCRAYGCEPLKFWLGSTPCLLDRWPSHPAEA